MNKYPYSRNNYCKCGKLITNNAKHCRKCAGKIHSGKMKGRGNPIYIDGRNNKKYYCINCGKKISISSGLYGSGRCQSCSNRITGKQKWRDKDYRRRGIKLLFEARNLKPNKQEKLLGKLLNELLPNKYHYVGYGEIILGSFNPDFINVNGQKKIIELFGCYWHKCPICKFGNKKPLDIGRIKTYRKYGYETLIIWEHELKDLNKLKQKILEFNCKVI